MHYVLYVALRYVTWKMWNGCVCVSGEPEQESEKKISFIVWRRKIELLVS